MLILQGISVPRFIYYLKLFCGTEKTENNNMKGQTKSFSAKVREHLGYYVYALLDSKDTIFYIGKGKGNRLFMHVKEALKTTDSFIINNNPKLKHIKEIGASNVKYMIIRHGLTHEHALIVESVLIDIFRQKNELKLSNIESLDNKNNGFESQGVHTIDEIELMYNKPEADILPNEKILAININVDTLDENKIYNRVKGNWVLDPKHANGADYIVASHNGLIIGIYKLNEGTGWMPSNEPNRFYFDGYIVNDEDVRKRLLHRSLKRSQGSQNPVKYINNWQHP